MRQSPIRWLARIVLSCCLIGALAVSGFNIWTLLHSPAGAAFTARSQEGIAAASERALLRAATAETVSARITSLLAETPRNWLAITASESLAAERGINLPPDVTVRRDEAYSTDHGLWMTGQKCARCTIDASTCELSAILLCRAPVDLSVIGDVAGLTRGAGAHLAGRDVDQVEMILSAIGLTAVALTVASGGSSLSIKAGAGFAKMAKAMNRLPATLTRPLMRAARAGIDWARLPSARRTQDVADLMRPAILSPATKIIEDTGRMVRRTGTLDGLHLMKYVDDPTDLSRIARVSEALGPRMVGVAETLGKSRLLRLTMRVADPVWHAAAGMIAALAALLSLVQSAMASSVMRLMRRIAS